MLIKTQDRRAVIECSSFEIERSIWGDWYINNIYPRTGKIRFLGRYATKERCKEIAGQIERMILRERKGIYDMPRR